MANKGSKELTPMMKQFFDLKAKHPDALLLFRCGDFYETYCDDAVIAAGILGITLTHRNNGVTGLNGILLCRQTVGVKTHWVQHIKALQTFVTTVDIAGDIAQRMSYVKTCSRWIREHV